MGLHMTGMPFRKTGNLKGCLSNILRVTLEFLLSQFSVKPWDRQSPETTGNKVTIM